MSSTLSETSELSLASNPTSTPVPTSSPSSLPSQDGIVDPSTKLNFNVSLALLGITAQTFVQNKPETFDLFSLTVLEITSLTTNGQVFVYSVQPILSKPDKGCIVLFSLDFFLLPRFTSSETGFENISTMLLSSCNTGKFNQKLSKFPVFNETTALRPPVFSAYTIYEFKDDLLVKPPSSNDILIMVVVFVTVFFLSLICLLVFCLHEKHKRDSYRKSWARWEDNSSVPPQQVPQKECQEPPAEIRSSRSELNTLDNQEVLSPSVSSIHNGQTELCKILDDREIEVSISVSEESSPLSGL